MRVVTASPKHSPSPRRAELGWPRVLRQRGVDSGGMGVPVLAVPGLGSSSHWQPTAALGMGKGEEISQSCSAAGETIALAHPYHAGPASQPWAGLRAEFL